MEGGVLRTLQQLALLLPLLQVLLYTPADAEAIQKEILTTWNGQPVEHVPVSIILDSSRDDQLQVVVDAPFYDDPAPPAPPNSSYIGLWDYEVVEVFFVNDVDQYLQIEITPQGQYFVLLFDGVRNHKRFSLPLTVEAEVTGGVSPSWTATVTVPTEYLPQGVSRFNAYSTHGASPNRVYEAYSPAPADAAGPDFHNLQYFAPLDLDPVIPGITDRSMSNLWLDAIAGRITYSINTSWNGSSLSHAPVNITLGGSEDTLFVSVSAPFFDDPAPPAVAGEPFFGLWEYEVVEAFFLNNENQYFELEVGPYGQNLGLLLWTKNDTYNQLRHSLPLKSSAAIDKVTGRWTATVEVPVDYLPPKVSRFNAYCKHVPGQGRHEESLYPQDSTDQVADFHALKYFQPIDMNSVIPDQSERPMSQLWQDTIQGVYRYEITTEWNSVPVAHDPVTLTLEGFEAGVELNVTAPFFNDPPPPGVAGQPLYGLWDYEVAEMFFLNDNDEYLEVELSPWGQHLLLMLKGERNAIKHSLALDYVVTERINGTGSQPGRWHGSALIPPSYFPPNVTRMNAYAIHGTGDSRVYEALYPAPHNDPQYPQPDFHNLGLFQKIDFEFLVVDNSQYSDLWLEAIANATTTPAPEAALKASDKGTKIEISEVIPRVDAKITVEETTVEDEEIETTTAVENVRDDLEAGVTDIPDIEISTVTTDESLTIPQKSDAVPTTIPQKQEAVGRIVPQKLDAIPTTVPQKQDAVPTTVPQKLNAVPTTVPQKLDAVPITVPQKQDVVPVTVPQKQDAVPTTIPQRQDAISSTVPQKQNAVPTTIPQRHDAVAKIVPQTQEVVPTAPPQKLDAVVPDTVTLDDSTDATTTADGGTEELRREEEKDEDVPTTTESWSEEEVTVEVTTEVRELDVPQPELVKEARKQDIEKPPPENLFRPIPIRAPPRTPMPTKLENTTVLESPTSDVLISNPSFVGQPPHFAHQHLFPPSSFFNPQSTFGQPIPLTQQRPAARPQATLVGGKPVAIQGLPRFPLPPQIKLKEHVPLTHVHLIPQQPHLDHLLDHHQKQQDQQHLPQHADPLSIPSSIAIQQLTEEQRDTQETNEILPLLPTLPKNEIIDNEEASSILSHSALQQNLETQEILDDTSLLDQVPQAQEHSLQEPPQPVPVSILPTILPAQPIITPAQPIIAPAQPIITPAQPIITPAQPIITPAQPIITPAQPIITPAQPIIQASPPRQTPQAAPAKPSSPAVIPTHQQSSVSATVPQSAIPFDHYPPPHDVCVTQGLHADPFRCPIFHECVLQNNEWQVYTWRCPRGKYFDDASLTCIQGYC